jgi:hypothetical protein
VRNVDLASVGIQLERASNECDWRYIRTSVGSWVRAVKERNGKGDWRECEKTKTPGVDLLSRGGLVRSGHHQCTFIFPLAKKIWAVLG